MTLRVAIRGLAAGIALALLVGCGGGGGGTSGPTTTPPPPPTPDFSLSVSPSTLDVAPGSSGGVQVAVAAQNGFTGTVTVTPSGLPTGVTSAAVDIASGSSATLSFTVSSSAASGTFPISIQGKSSAISHMASFSLVVPASPPSPDFSVSASPGALTVARESSGNIQVSVTAKNAFTGSVAVSATNLPGGITAAPVSVPAGGTGTVALNVAPATGPGPFTISLTGTSGTLSHSTSVTLTVPFGGGVLTIVPRTSGQFAMPQADADYLNLLEKDVAPVRLAKCGSASSSLTFEMVNNPADSTSTHTEGSDHFINIQSLPTIPAKGVKDYSQYSVYETAHALQYDLLHIPAGGPNPRGTHSDLEGWSQACTNLVYRDLSLAGKGTAPKDGGSLGMLWLDTFRRIDRFDAETIGAGGWIDACCAYAGPMLAVGETTFLMAAGQKGAHGFNGMVEHENAIFAAQFATDANHPLTADDRIRVWDSVGLTIDGESAGQWMSPAMIHDPAFTVGKPHLIAWPVLPQFPAQMTVQAFVIQSADPSFQPVIQTIPSGPITITVKDAAGHVVLTKSADFSQTADIGGYTPSLQTALAQGVYTVFVDATINGTALEQHFVVANIPFALTNAAGNDLSFPGQYLVAVDSAGNANAGSLTVTRGKTVFTMTGFAIVKPDSTGTFDVIGPSGTKHTYTAPEPWARFIPVE